MVICQCLAVSDRLVRDSIESGATSVEEITQDCQAGGGCGGCWRRLEAMLAESTREKAAA